MEEIKTYKIIWSPSFKKELSNMLYYISNILQEPKIDQKLINSWQLCTKYSIIDFNVRFLPCIISLNIHLLRGVFELKKFLAMIFCLCIICSLNFVTINAMAPTELETLSARATSKGLYYVENQTIINLPEGTPPTGVVYPEQGANLRVWLKNSDGPMKVVVYQTNWLGNWSKIYTNTFATGERDVLITDNCNGKAYKIEVYATDLYATYSLLAYQN